MDIRKIIREEMDGFDWAKETDFLSKEYLLGKGIEFSPPMDGDEIEYFDYVLKTLKDIGFRVSFNVDGYMVQMVDDNEEVTGLYINPGGGVIITGTIWDETYQEHINEYVSGGGYRSEGHVDVVQGREIFHMNMNESNDFEWIEDIQVKTPITDLKPHDTYMIIEMPEKTKRIYADDGFLGERPPYATEFTIDEDAFRNENYLQHGIDEFIPSVWVSIGITQQHGGWLPSEGIYVSKTNNLNESTDFDWVEDIPEGPIHIGAVLHVNFNYDNPNTRDSRYIDLQIEEINGDEVIYRIIEYYYTDDEYEPEPCTDTEDFDEDDCLGGRYNIKLGMAEKLVEEGFWVPLTQWKSLNESEFDWVKEVKPSIGTLGELYDNGRIDRGDVIEVRGETFTWNHSTRVPIHTTFTIVNFDEKNFEDITVTTDDGTAGRLGVINDAEGFALVDEDRYLDVLSIEKDTLTESMDWAKEINPTPYNGVKFKNHPSRIGDSDIVYTITDNGGPHVVVSWNNGDSYTGFERGEVEEHFRKGLWIII